ncbi:Hpt domain-containing protein [Aspergillus melleus]|uniref:Hpt domain-containing protein n=1 Tax=Aspergillus melleus TaxID=138277 RepID=UPI001E8E1605|nr:Phosphorelay intermediate protein [Aspergillus melleus]KAH8428316.1 Phosphorelay intermediate protein [Aspergillus melleus]
MAPTTTTKTVEEPPKSQSQPQSQSQSQSQPQTQQQPKEEDTPADLDSMTDLIDQNTFDQILEMDDDDDDREFSKGIVFGFFDQAESTFDKMEKALEEKKLAELSSLGHFLKGSSATLGLIKVKDACEKIQHFGAGKDETGSTDEPDDEVSLKNIQKTLTQAKKDYKEVEKFLRKYFGES